MPDIELTHSCLVPCTEKMTEYAKRICTDRIAERLIEHCSVEHCVIDGEKMVNVEVKVIVRRGE